MKRILLVILASVMVFSLAACAQPTPTTPAVADTAAPSAAATDEATATPEAQPAVGGQIIWGSTTDISGDFGRAMWTNNAADKIIRELIDDYRVTVANQGGEFLLNETVAESMEGVVNEDGTKTFTVKLHKDLLWNNGDPITAKDFVAGVLLFAHPTAFEAGAKGTAYLNFVGGDAYQKGETDVFTGVRLIDEHTFSVTVVADKIPFFYDIQYLNDIFPLSIPMWLGEGIDIVDEGEGAKFTGDMSFAAVGATIDAARYVVDGRVSAGPYNLVSWDPSSRQAVLEINENYKGNFEGQKPYIQKIVMVKVEDETMIDNLKTGGVELLDKLADGDNINAALDVVDAGGFAYSNFERNGYGKLMFQCDFGPTQFEGVRHAIAYLLDRNEFASTFTGGYGAVVHGPYGLAMWMYQEGEEQLNDRLNTYAYSKDAAIEALVADGWVYDAEGKDYVEGIRYKKVTEEEAGDYVHNVKLADGTILMPLIIDWASSENNSVSELLKVMLAENADLAASGIQINQAEMTFDELLNYMYRDISKGDKYGVKTYGMYNLASNFTPNYDQSYLWTIDPELVAQGYNSNYTKDALLDQLSMEMVYGVESGDNEAYLEKWIDFVVRFNEYLPEIPLYSNVYYSVYKDSLKNYEPSALWDFQNAIIYAYTEVQ